MKKKDEYWVIRMWGLVTERALYSFIVTCNVVVVLNASVVQFLNEPWQHYTTLIKQLWIYMSLFIHGLLYSYGDFIFVIGFCSFNYLLKQTRNIFEINIRLVAIVSTEQKYSYLYPELIFHREYLITLILSNEKKIRMISWNYAIQNETE